MGNIICVKFLPLAFARDKIFTQIMLPILKSLGVNFYADNVTHIKISNKLTPSINYFLI